MLNKVQHDEVGKQKPRRGNAGVFCYYATMIKKLFLLAIVMGLTLFGYMYYVATSDPLVRKADVMVSNWPEGQVELKLLLVSDIHVAGPDMPPERLKGIVEQINALEPDIVTFAGDFVSDKRTATKRYSANEALAPLKSLRAEQGVFAVLGNHDHWRNSAAIGKILIEVGITVLTNEAVQAGPLILGGIDDDFTDRADVPVTLSKMEKLSGFPVYLSHSPDIVPDLPAKASLILAGHTHCGQIVLPFIGAIATMSEYGERFACGNIEEGEKIIFVSAGLGTSILPLRLGAVPDMWLISLGPKHTE
jgi:predicted MPP superfamily phosphohydrolase